MSLPKQGDPWPEPGQPGYLDWCKRNVPQTAGPYFICTDMPTPFGVSKIGDKRFLKLTPEEEEHWWNEAAGFLKRSNLTREQCELFVEEEIMDYGPQVMATVRKKRQSTTKELNMARQTTTFMRRKPMDEYGSDEREMDEACMARAERIEIIRSATRVVTAFEELDGSKESGLYEAAANFLTTVYESAGPPQKAPDNGYAEIFPNEASPNCRNPLPEPGAKFHGGGFTSPLD